MNVPMQYTLPIKIDFNSFGSLATPQMHLLALAPLFTLALIGLSFSANAKPFEENNNFAETTAIGEGDESPFGLAPKRTMRNALIRFGRSARSPRSARSSATMRNALVRFGKRSAPPLFEEERKRNSVPEPFVRFGRSGSSLGRTAAGWEEEPLDSVGGGWQPFAFAFL